MNLLTVQKYNQSPLLDTALRIAGQKGNVNVSRILYAEGVTEPEFVFRLRSLQWTTSPGPNAIVCVADQEANLAILPAVLQVANRDGCLFFLFVPDDTQVSEEAQIKTEDLVLEQVPSSFVLYDVPLTSKPRETATALIQLTQQGFFGRYRMIPASHGSGLDVIPYIRRRKH